MCGIVGFITQDSRLNKKAAEDMLSNMCSAIRYRGPDDHGIFLSGFDQHSDTRVGLGHNRLSIIDLSSAGHQPMSNEDSSIWLTYNGEIYNFLELKDYLVKRGHIFRSLTDSEVIIHGYEEWGKDCVDKFNGMFAFAIWDEKQHILLLARDRMGQKPLYYSFINGDIIFASEPKAILEFSNFKREINFLSLSKYFLYEYVPSPSTIYKAILRLPAANILIWQDRNISVKKYWSVSFSNQGRPKDIMQLRDLLKDSVKMRLISDVPLGVFLSGGIDSSTIVKLMTEIISARNTKTFTIGFADRSFDESSFASKVARVFNTDHYEKILSPEIMLKIIPEILNFLDEPFADASIIPTYLLSKFTREYVTVALGGDGGDELFAGYDTFPAHRLARLYEKIPAFLKKCFLEKIIYSLPVSFDNISFDFRLKQFLKGMPYKPEIRNQVWIGSFSPQEQLNLFSEELNNSINNRDILNDICTAVKECNARNYLELIIYLYCKFYLQDDILTKVDRASMANSLEVRAPFLDVRFLEYVFGLASNLKLRGFKTKYILKKIMKDELPAGIADRAKKGFGIPVAKWLRSDLKNILTDELAPEKLSRENILNPSYVQRLVVEHIEGRKDNRKQLWTILIFELWYKKWVINR